MTDSDKPDGDPSDKEPTKWDELPGLEDDAQSVDSREPGIEPSEANQPSEVGPEWTNEQLDDWLEEIGGPDELEEMFPEEAPVPDLPGGWEHDERVRAKALNKPEGSDLGNDDLAFFLEAWNQLWLKMDIGFFNFPGTPREEGETYLAPRSNAHAWSLLSLERKAALRRGWERYQRAADRDTREALDAIERRQVEWAREAAPRSRWLPWVVGGGIAAALVTVALVLFLRGDGEPVSDEPAIAVGAGQVDAIEPIESGGEDGGGGLAAVCDLGSSDADCLDLVADCAAGVGDGCGDLIDECAAGATDGACEQILAQCDEPEFDAACEECIAEGTCGEVASEGDTGSGAELPALEGPQAKLVGGWGHADGSSIIFSAEGEIDVTTPDGEKATGTFQAGPGPSEIIINVVHPDWEDCPPEPATFDWFINEVEAWLQLSPFPGDCFAQLAFFARGVVGPDEERVWSRDDESGPVVEAQGGTIDFTMDLSGGTCSEYASSYSQTVELTADPAPAAAGQWIVVMVNPESGQAVHSDPWDASSGDPLVMVFDGEYSEVYTYNPAIGTFDYDYTDENGQDCAWQGEISDSQEFQVLDDFMGGLVGG